MILQGKDLSSLLLVDVAANAANEADAPWSGPRPTSTFSIFAWGRALLALPPRVPSGSSLEAGKAHKDQYLFSYLSGFAFYMSPCIAAGHPIANKGA